MLTHTHWHTHKHHSIHTAKSNTSTHTNAKKELTGLNADIAHSRQNQTERRSEAVSMSKLNNKIRSEIYQLFFGFVEHFFLENTKPNEVNGATHNAKQPFWFCKHTQLQLQANSSKAAWYNLQTQKTFVNLIRTPVHFHTHTHLFSLPCIMNDV